LPVTIGLGRSIRVDGLEIIWPGGSKQIVTDIKIDSTITIEQSSNSK
jgi:hypothetical protein